VILVSGGAGFIGSNLVAELSEAGAEVAVCDRFRKGQKWRNLASSAVTDFVSPESLAAFLEERGDELTYVYHLGAISSTTERDVDLIVDTNVRLSQFIWRWCASHDVPLVYASSAATYGDGSNGFVDDGRDEALARLRPLNAYGWSKHAFDRWVVREVERGRPVPPQWAGLKFFNVYGPNEYHKGAMQSVVAKSYPAAAAGDPVTLFRSHHPDYADGGQLRDFIYVRDCVDVMTWLREHSTISGLYNVGTGRAQSFRELIEAVFEAVGHPASFAWVDTPEEIRDRYQYFTEADMSRLRAAGYTEPFASVSQGVTDYVTRFLATDDPYR
jgi:ADP-L-glycero-D-manno-heptose 6-epimerase